ncbi:MAG: hypothetical protein ACYTEX_26030 [Planctomycetota bacterium]|jgi:hypothetical protein
MSDSRFYDGQQLQVLYFPGEEGGVIRSSKDGVDSIEVCMELGQMGLVPWALVTRTDGTQDKWNLALCEGVGLCKQNKE